MFGEQLSTAIESASPNQFDGLARDLWRAWSAGHISDDQAQAGAERIAARQREKGGMRNIGPPSNNRCTGFSVARVSLPKRRNQQTPDKAASIARRRRLAAAGGLPPRLAEHFTVSEQATLRVVFNAIRHNGLCAFCLDQIAAMAGCCRSVAKSALRKARLFGLLTVQERRRAGQKSLPNIVRVIADELRRWLRLPDKGSVRPTTKTGIRGGQKNDPYSPHGVT